MDEGALVAKARAGEPSALTALYEHLAPDVWGFLCGLRLDLDRAEQEDALQETFLRVFRALDRYDEARALRPWVLGVAHHVAVDLCRRRTKAARDAGSDLERVAGDGAAAGEVAGRAEERGLVADALDALKAEHRAALALRHLQGLTMPELAEALGCSVPTARVRLRDAARLLAGELRARGVIGEGEVQA